jgi:hypothetical protein
MPLNLTKIAFGAESAAHLAERLDSYAVQGEARLTTRYLPKRHEEMVGGSLYWIVKHMLIGRSPLIGFMDNGAGRIWIRIQPILIPIQSTPRRAHQGWRYLEDANAPRDLAAGEVDTRDQMPSKLLGDLMRMGLV